MNDNKNPNPTLLFPLPVLSSSANAQSEQEAQEIHFHNIKLMAVHYMTCELLKCVQMMNNTHMCAKEHFADIELPHNLFSWTLADCMKRRKLNMVWYNLLLKKILSPQCLEIRKIKNDFDELNKFIRMIMQGYMIERNSSSVMAHLKSSSEYLQLEETLVNQQRQGYYDLKDAMNNLVAMEFVRPVRRGSKRISLKSLRDKDSVFENTVARYNAAYYRSLEYQAKIICELQQEKVRKEIETQTKRLQNEDICSQSSLNFYYSHLESLRERIKHMTEKLSKDEEVITNKTTYRRGLVEKLQTQQQFLSEERLRFRDEIAEYEKQRALAEMKLLEKSESKKSIVAPPVEVKNTKKTKKSKKLT